MLLKNLVGTLIFFSLTMTQGNAADFTEADRLFSLREGNQENIRLAKQEYKSLLEGPLNSQEKIYAVSQLGKLALYEGDKFYGKESADDKLARKSIYKDCWDNFMQVLNPVTKQGGERGDRFYGSKTPFPEENPQFFYYSSACMALYGEVSGTAENVKQVSRLLWLLRRGESYDTQFEGAGILRVKAGVISNKKAEPLNLYNPEKALQMIDSALSTPPYPGSQSSGANYCENYERKIFILQELSRKAASSGDDIKAAEFSNQAAEVITNTIAWIDELEDLEEMPEGREPETRKCRDDISAM